MRSVRPAVAALALAVALAAAACSACSPGYVLQAGLAEARILAGRRPIEALIRDPDTPRETRRKLQLVLAARAFARDSLGLDVGTSYTTFTELEEDTLALVLSAAHPDRFEPVTWWFPIVGRVPYRGFFDREAAVEEERRLRQEGLDTYLRPTSAFSTLGWFSDPLLSTILGYDDTPLVETVIHELTHNTLYLPGRTRFNESFANFVGYQGAIAFFCGGGGYAGGEACRLARGRWHDAVRFSSFLDGLVEELRALYGDPGLTREEKVSLREPLFQEAVERFRGEVQPDLEVSTYRYFLETPLNNATLLARMRYHHRLEDFDVYLRVLAEDLPEAIDRIRREAHRWQDPFDALSAGTEPAPRVP